jgi:hypothetical protein
MTTELWKKMQELNCRVAKCCDRLGDLDPRTRECVENASTQSSVALNLINSLLVEDNVTITDPGWGFSPGYSGQIYRTTSQPLGSNLVILPLRLTALAAAPTLSPIGGIPAGFTPVSVGLCMCELISGGTVTSSAAVFVAGALYGLTGILPAAISAGDTLTITITYQA